MSERKPVSGENESQENDFESRGISIRMPNWMIQAVDKEAKRIGNTRQGVINGWIAERLGAMNKKSTPEESD